MKNIYRFSFALLFIIAMCGTPILSHAQTSEEKTLEVKDAFLGRWKDTRDPNHLLEIYKEGAFIVVQTRSEVKDGAGNKKYTVSSERGNRIMVDLGSSVTPLTIADDASKISFMGNEYVKK